MGTKHVWVTAPIGSTMHACIAPSDCADSPDFALLVVVAFDCMDQQHIDVVHAERSRRPPHRRRRGGTAVVPGVQLGRHVEHGARDPTGRRMARGARGWGSISGTVTAHGTRHTPSLHTVTAHSHSTQHTAHTAHRHSTHGHSTNSHSTQSQHTAHRHSTQAHHTRSQHSTQRRHSTHGHRTHRSPHTPPPDRRPERRLVVVR